MRPTRSFTLSLWSHVCVRPLQVQTLLAGIRPASASSITAAKMQQLLPVPASFFRPLLLLAAMNARGNPYAPVTPAQVEAGEPPKGWCLPAFVFSSQHDENKGDSVATAEAASTSRTSGSADGAKRLFGACPFIAPGKTNGCRQHVLLLTW